MHFIELQSRINNAKALDFGNILSQSIELFKKVWLQGLITVIITGALMLPFIFVMYIPLIAMGIVDPDSMEPSAEPNIVFMLPFLIFVLAFMVVAMAISFGLLAAFYRIVKQKDLSLTGTDDYFYFLKKAYLKKTIKLSLYYLGIVLLASLLCVLPVFYAIIPATFIIVVYAMNPDLSESEILKISFGLGNKKWLLAFGLFVVSYIIAMFVGFLLCVIGLYVTQMFIYLPFYQIYKEVVGVDNDSDLEEIGKIENL